jgi:S1-C subfamily serine protease
MGKAARARKALNAGAADAGSPAGSPRRAVFARIRESVVGIVDAADDWPTAIATSQVTPMTAISLLGTGFIIDNNIVLTAKHVVQHFIDRTLAWEANKAGPRPPAPKFLFSTAFLGAKQANVDMQFVMGAASKISIANEIDMASLRIVPPPPGSGMKIPRPLKLSATPCEEGDDVAVCGYPLGWNLHSDYFGGALLSPSFSSGIISAVLPHSDAPVVNRNMLQIDAMINPGNSGGPVFNMRTGEVVGIVVSRTENVIQTAPGQLLGGQDRIVISIGLARALPIHLAQFVIKSIEDPVVGLLQP